MPDSHYLGGPEVEIGDLHLCAIWYQLWRKFSTPMTSYLFRGLIH